MLLWALAGVQVMRLLLNDIELCKRALEARAIGIWEVGVS